MLQSLSSTPIFTFFILILTFHFCTLFSPSVHASLESPEIPIFPECTAFAEGQAFYLFRGVFLGMLQDNFILDLSVPWNTSNPVLKEVATGPMIFGKGCTTTDNGDLFVLTAGAGFIYNLKSNSWTPFEHPNFATSTPGQFGVTDPETGIIYIKEEAMDFRSESTMYSIDLKTKTVNTSKIYLPVDVDSIAWSAYLKSIVAVDRPISLFTPSKMAEPSGGRSTFIATNKDNYFPIPGCAAPAYGGSVIVFTGVDTTPLKPFPKEGDVPKGSYVYILDVVKRTWKRGPLQHDLVGTDPVCAVSGDYFIVWGVTRLAVTSTLVYNIKTEKWVSSYIPPLPRPTTTILQPSSTPSTALEAGNTSSSDTKLVIIIAAVTGVLLAIILGLIFRFYRRTRQLDPNGSSTSSLNIKDSVKTPKPGWVGQLHGGIFGVHQVSEHPHAIVEDPTVKHSLQESAIAFQMPTQHPHTMVGRQEFPLQMPPQHLHIMVDKQELAFQIPPPHPHAIGKAELDEQ